jgi:hypothetical protein
MNSMAKESLVDGTGVVLESSWNDMIRSWLVWVPGELKYKLCESF